MRWSRLRALASAAAIVAAIVIFVRAGLGEWREISRASLHLRLGWLAVSFVVNLSAFFLDTVSIQRAYRATAARPHLLTLPRAVALYNVSSLLKYLPGRVWALVSQIERATRNGLEAESLIQANLVCVAVAINTGFLTGALFLGLYGFERADHTTEALALIPLVVACTGLASYQWWPRVLKGTMRILRRPMPASWRLPSVRQMLGLVAIYLFNWTLAGVGGVAAWLAFANGGSVTDMLLVGSSMGAGWTIALLAFIVPGGIGVREGAILFMLDTIVGREAALVLPLLTRVIYMACEAVLGALGLLLARELRGAAD
ncbi:MAG TPA: lysylphosphatidylglycerol synthase domain-containing protein [Polyangiaceae bacterium]|jgi:hypothetical protein